MSTGKGDGSTSQKAAHEYSDQTERQETPSITTALSSSSTPRREDDQTSTPASASPGEERGPTAQRDQPSESTYPSTEETIPTPRQVIAVSASKGPAAFFNLARKFLVTDETCDLSALEGAIVSAVDAAHLLERSRLATIVRVQTSYVTVEPKRRKPAPAATPASPSTLSVSGTQPTYVSATPLPPQESIQTRRGSSGRELRRARIVITVKRTESYKRWLEENPLQAIIAGDGDDELAEGTATDKPASK